MTNEIPPWRRKRGDDPARGLLTRLNEPLPVRVAINARGLPLEVERGRGRGGRRYVVEVQDIWRVDDEWWRAPISRRYYQLVMDDGGLWTIFEDLESGEWFEQRS